MIIVVYKLPNTYTFFAPVILVRKQTIPLNNTMYSTTGIIIYFFISKLMWISLQLTFSLHLSHVAVTYVGKSIAIFDIYHSFYTQDPTTYVGI